VQWVNIVKIFVLTLPLAQLMLPLAQKMNVTILVLAISARGLLQKNPSARPAVQ
jgi:hypothetical protein